ncbi:MAG TPA: lipopolysaccharide biosynthesis protein [Myxococcales bacterium]
MRALVRRWTILYADSVGRSGPLLLSRVASAVLTFALPLVLVRLLDRHSFGTYKQFFLVTQTLLLVGQLGLTQSLYYFLPRGTERRGAYVVQVTALLAALGALVGVGIATFGAPLLARALASPDLLALRLPLAVTAAAMLAAAPLEATLVSEGRLGQAAFAYTASDFLRAAGIVLAAAFVGGPWIFWAAALVSLLRMGLLWSLLSARLLPASAPSRKLLGAQLSYALPFAGSSLLYVLQEYFPQYAVSACFDPATYALFAVASFHMSIVDIIYSPMSEVLMVELGQSDGGGPREASARHWRATVQRLATLLFPAAVGSWLVGPTLLPMLFTKAYAPAVPLFVLATAEIPFWILPCDAVLRAYGDTRFLFGFSAVRLGVTALLVVAGVHWFGVAGAIGAGIASEIFGVSVLFARARQHLQARASELLDWRGLARSAAAAAFAALPGLALRFVLPPGKLLVALSVLLYVPIYFTARMKLARREPVMPLPLVASLGEE